MTPSELRELDKWIAEHVFGWRWFSNPPNHPIKNTHLTDPTHHLLEYWKSVGVTEGKLPGYAEVYAGPLYSTAGDPALSVLEQCITQIDNTVCFGRCDEGFCVFIGGQFGRPTTQRAETLPLAICLFARKLFLK